MKTLYIIPAFLLYLAGNAQPVIKVEVSADTVAPGEMVEVTYTIENGDDKWIMPDMKGIPVISGPNSSSSFLYQDGKMSSSQSYSFTLMPQKAGKLVIPKTTYVYGQEKMNINPVEIVVLEDYTHHPVPPTAPEEDPSKKNREKRKF